MPATRLPRSDRISRARVRRHAAKLWLLGWRKCTAKAAASVRETLSVTEEVAITNAAWTALATEACAYGTETVNPNHFLTDWVVQSAILQFRSMPERHTAEKHVGLTFFVSKYLLFI